MLAGSHLSARSQLDMCLAKLNLHKLFGRISPGLSDDSDEIRVISHMMPFRPSQVACGSATRRGDPQLEKTMKGAIVTNDTVKQDLERAAENCSAWSPSSETLFTSPEFDVAVSDIIFVFEALGSKRHKPVERSRGRRPAAGEETLGGGSPLRMR